MTPKLSVTVTNYNYARFLPTALDSILGQTFEDYELIIIDNASQDGSQDIIKAYERQDRRLRVVFHDHNYGMLASLRESCQIARGKYRVHVDADDWILKSDAFRQQLDLIESERDIVMVFSALSRTGVPGDVSHVSHPFVGNQTLPGVIAFESIMKYNINHSGMMFRMESYDNVGGYPSRFPAHVDMFLAALLCGEGRIGYIDSSLYAFRQHGYNYHMVPRSDLVAREILPMLEMLLKSPAVQNFDDIEAVVNRIKRNALVHHPTQYIFSGNLAIGWLLYWHSIRQSPWCTFAQRRTLALVARSVLGAKVYESLLGVIHGEDR